MCLNNCRIRTFNDVHTPKNQLFHTDTNICICFFSKKKRTLKSQLPIVIFNGVVTIVKISLPSGLNLTFIVYCCANKEDNKWKPIQIKIFVNNIAEKVSFTLYNSFIIYYVDASQYFTLHEN